MGTTQNGPEIGPSPESLSKEQLVHQIERQAEEIADLRDRIERLESSVDEIEYQADTIEDVAEQFQNGKIGGEAGADFLREFVSTPEPTNQLDARASRLFFTIIEERRIGMPTRTQDVVSWLELHDSANPSVQASRVMDRMKRHREDGHYIGTVEQGKHRGQNCIWLHRE